MINPKKRKEQRIIIITFISIFMIAFIGLVVSLLVSGTSNNIQAQNAKKVTDSRQENRNLQEEIKKVNETYKEAKAWLKVPGTSIDSAIYQSTDNDRYLRNDKDNVQTRWGENFVDYRCNLDNITNPMQNYIIYGHNTEIDTRFTPLLEYKDKTFFDDHQIIELATLNGYYRFQVFAAYQTTTDFYYIDTNFKDAKDFESFVNSLKEKSAYDNNVEVTSEDTILTLSTCDYSIENGRFVVHAKLLK